MAFGGFHREAGGHTMAEINMVPLIDVMLVLLVIFIITAPLMAHSIQINMPHVASEPISQKPVVLDLAIDAAGKLYVDDKPITMADLPARMAQAAAMTPEPELHIRADHDTRYEVLADVMSDARKAGLDKIGFVTTPPQNAAGAQAGAAQPAS